MRLPNSMMVNPGGRGGGLLTTYIISTYAFTQLDYQSYSTKPLGTRTYVLRTLYVRQIRNVAWP